MPAFQNIDQAKGYDAAGALTKKRFVKFDGTNTGAVVMCSADSDVPCGVTMFSVSSAEILRGKGASVVTDGIALMEAGEAINEGDPVGPDSNGKAIVADSGKVCAGFARSNASGDTIEVAVQLADAPFIV